MLSVSTEKGRDDMILPLTGFAYTIGVICSYFSSYLLSLPVCVRGRVTP
ncbi:hypothetical protein DPX39_090053000 [Trypanosoma brucei equiperdum]|uniref:Uncharacterized protein n=1 Tax=Trypanosoma brucei equiperdum TaxID=630700 RepID=A0A3L6L211_9TRYP|nr:hypothetical protein DPX39_090053000 [Trypanosoma brucei equiperdum]